MKTWKLVSGILSCILFVLVSLQSCAVGTLNTLGETGEIGGSGGIVLAILMLCGGIVSICTRKSKGNGANIAMIILFGLAAFLGYGTAGSYSDLEIWSGWCVINAVMAFLALFIGKNKKSED